MALSEAPRALMAALAFTLFMGPFKDQLLIVSFTAGGMIRSEKVLDPDDCFTLAAQLHKEYDIADGAKQGVDAVFCIDSH